jgi:hypothetical protein
MPPVLVAFARLDGFDRFDASVAELGEQRFDDVVLHAQATTVSNEIAELPAGELPMVVEGAGFRPGGLRQEREAIEFRLQIELHERLGQRRAAKRAIGCEVQWHDRSGCDAGGVTDFDFEVARWFEIGRHA